MYKIDRRGGGVQKSFTRTDPFFLSPNICLFSSENHYFLKFSKENLKNLSKFLSFSLQKCAFFCLRLSYKQIREWMMCTYSQTKLATFLSLLTSDPDIYYKLINKK